ncbi:3-hydroxyacyl-CoA dehydrogenase type-2 [Daphnia magna]|uniref:3-hydroxyacyl-CoA dehydrogenase type-2 n=2 Tax=Daphnia magna TaxID=35525 RepID=A0A0P5Q759_9CRUS|nr:hypothetical protein OUZ56_006695 [Daphnia magna]KZS18089.1 3-hydroxyacyl-CoA dehydrogenase type-2 [Daphnia magna]
MAQDPENVRKVALITGSSCGIGAATAVQFATLGYRLSLYALNIPADEAGLAETKSRCLTANPQLTSDDIVTMTGDLTVEENCHFLIAKTIETFKRIDVLVANAGIVSASRLENMKMEDFDKVMNINCRVVVLMNKLVIPYLSETKGNIINVSSVAGIRACTDMMAYCMSKAAIAQLTRCAASELASKGIRVNAVCPGIIGNTEIFSNAGLSKELQDFTFERAKSTHPLGRAGTPEEVAKSIAFLASEEHASFLTGVTLPVDGGRCVSS